MNLLGNTTKINMVTPYLLHTFQNPEILLVSLMIHADVKVLQFGFFLLLFRTPLLGHSE